MVARVAAVKQTVLPSNSLRLGLIDFVGLVADIVGLTEVEVSWLMVVVVMVGLKAAKWSARESG